MIEEVRGDPSDASSVVVLAVRGLDGETRERTWSRSRHRVEEVPDG